jgi:hypothetical protein
LLEAENLLRGTSVVEEAEVLTLKAGDEAAFLIRDGKDEIYFVDSDNDLERIVGVGRRLL